MALQSGQPTNHSAHDEDIPPLNYYREVENEDTTYLADNRLEMFPLQTVSFAASKSSIRQRALSPLGKPTMKKRLHTLDALAVGLSLICLVLVILAVENNKISWHLGLGNHQLIVVGFLLNIMNLCLGSITPTLFLLLEAKFGASILQNYDAILRSKPLASRLSTIWRVNLCLMLALPIGLSVAYKTFIGGESALKVDTMDYIHLSNSTANSSYYGMFPPPGLLTVGTHTGITIFFNATLPFLVASALTSDYSEPPPPLYPQSYGFNTLSIDNESTAMLDILHPAYIATIQGLLALGESWVITAPVAATVATFNRSKIEDPKGFNSSFMLACETAVIGQIWNIVLVDIFNGWNLVLLEQIDVSDQSKQYLGLAPTTQSNCNQLFQYIQLYNINRQLCQGTWSITRGGIQLIDGSCGGTILAKQGIIVHQEPPGFWYTPSLIDALGSFSGGGDRGSQSAWFAPSMVTSVAAMVWSRVTGLTSLAQFNQSDSSFTHLEDIGLLYPVNQTVLYIRPTLRKTGWLYFIFAVQPLLAISILVLMILFHSTPLDKGFGLISILSGIDRRSLDNLAGASLSGELVKPVKLVVRPVQEDDRNGAVEYRMVTSSAVQVRNGKLLQNVIYH